MKDVLLLTVTVEILVEVDNISWSYLARINVALPVFLIFKPVFLIRRFCFKTKLVGRNRFIKNTVT